MNDIILYHGSHDGINGTILPSSRANQALQKMGDAVVKAATRDFARDGMYFSEIISGLKEKELSHFNQKPWDAENGSEDYDYER